MRRSVALRRGECLIATGLKNTRRRADARRTGELQQSVHPTNQAGAIMGTESRISQLAHLPFSNENTRLVRTVWSPLQIPSTALMGVEQTQYFPGGSGALHSDDRSEEVIYFRQGRGEVQLDDKVVQVGPGSTVCVPKNVAHQVRNTGKDLLEHILITGDLTLPQRAPSALPEGLDYLVRERQGNGLERLSAFRIRVAPGETTQPLTSPDRECVYVASSGYVVAKVRTHEDLWDFEYALNTSNSMWVPAGPPHSFRNVGDVPAVIIGFMCLARPSAVH
jgi:mannose-6-phosphate isomerase-like protein (cupin superfamily)